MWQSILTNCFVSQNFRQIQKLDKDSCQIINQNFMEIICTDVSIYITRTSQNQTFDSLS